MIFWLKFVHCVNNIPYINAHGSLGTKSLLAHSPAWLRSEPRNKINYVGNLFQPGTWPLGGEVWLLKQQTINQPSGLGNITSETEGENDWNLGTALASTSARRTSSQPLLQRLQNSPLNQVVPFDGQKARPEQSCCNWLWRVRTVSWGKHHFLSAFPESVKNMFVLAFFRLRVIFSTPPFEGITLHLVTKMRAGSKLTPQH